MIIQNMMQNYKNKDKKMVLPFYVVESGICAQHIDQYDFYENIHP